MARDYRKGDLLRVMVSHVESRATSLPFDYYEVGFQHAEEDFMFES